MSQRNEGNWNSAVLVSQLTQKARRLDLADRLVSARREISGRMVFTTSFGIEDQAITHAIFTEALEIDVVTFDTGRLFPESVQVWSNTERRYGRRICALSPDRESIEKLVQRDGVNGFRQSLEARLACCAVRKIEPLARALAGASAWITGLRADQSPERAQTCYASVNPLYRMIKVNPLFEWTRDRVVAFVHDHRVPYNPLHDRGSSRSAVRRAPAQYYPARRSGPGAGGGNRKKKPNAGSTPATLPGVRSRHKSKPDDEDWDHGWISFVRGTGGVGALSLRPPLWRG
jgi:phosphoadenosine phosphosulfate reductase